MRDGPGPCWTVLRAATAMSRIHSLPSGLASRLTLARGRFRQIPTGGSKAMRRPAQRWVPLEVAAAVDEGGQPGGQRPDDIYGGCGRWGGEPVLDPDPTASQRNDGRQRWRCGIAAG